MTHDRNNHRELGPGQHDRQGRQSDLTDRRHGAHDNVAPKPQQPLEEKVSAHEAAQTDADVRSETEPNDQSIPEGLKRERKHPLNPSSGRSDKVPAHVPKA
jgi:hypothetical protein